MTRAVDPTDDPTQHLAQCLLSHYGLSVSLQKHQARGLDANAQGFRVTTPDDKAYYLKLWRREVNQPALSVPRALADSGVRGIVPPIRTVGGDLWARCQSRFVVLYPFVEGIQAGGNGLTATQWTELGAILGQIHSCPLESGLVATVHDDAFELRSAKSLRRVIDSLDTGPPLQKAAARYGALLLSHRHLVEEILDRAEAMRDRIATRPTQLVVCHADVHPWNIIVETSGGLKVVDWDDGPLVAPKERDFIFVPDEYLRSFLQGYGPSALDMELLEYFRAERRIEDMASTAALVFDSACADDSLIEEYVGGQERFFAGLAGEPEETNAPAA